MRRITGVVAACMCAAGAAGQSGGVAAILSQVNGDAVTGQRDAFLAQAKLMKPLAAALRQRLSKASGEAKGVLAEQLAMLYAKMLNATPLPAERQELEARCRQLMSEVPEAATPALRLTLTAARYLPVEEFAERHFLKMSTAEEDAEAERVVRSAAPEFEEIAVKLNNTVKGLEAKKDSGTPSDAEMEALRTNLEDYRELRSRARFYAGWSSYYLALLTHDAHHAVNAMEQFGGLLNAVPGRAATIDRLPTDLLHFDHIAKAVMGCALCCSLMGKEKEVESERWIAELEKAPELPPAVAEQLLRRKVQVLAASDRWNDVELAVTRARQVDRSAPVMPLALADARMLAVVSLEALRRPDFRVGFAPIAQRMAQIALGDLVTRGEVGHVLSLSKTYGTALIGRDGFINRYVRGLRAFEDVRDAHKAGKTEKEGNAPATTSELINGYRDAATLLGDAIDAPDAKQFAPQRATALLYHGLALYYSGSNELAADQFEAVFAGEGAEQMRRNALSYAITALDQSIANGAKALSARRDRLVTLFIKAFPRDPLATELLLGQIRAGQKTGTQEIDTLLKVASDSPLYESARRVACDLLYDVWKRSPEKSRDFAAIRYADVCSELLNLEFAQATVPANAANGVDTRKIAEGAINRARRLADVLLMCSSPNVQRAEAALAMVDKLSAYHGISLGNRDEEMTYRRMQIAIAKRDMATAEKELTHLRGLGGTYLPIAEKRMYQRVVEEWGLSPTDEARAQLVVSVGSRVLAQKDWGEAALASVRDRTAEAAAFLWTARHETVMRDLAIKLDSEQLAAGRRTASSLRRLARLREQAGDIDGSVSCWVELLAASDEESEEWFECRYESIRVIAKRSREESVALLDQFKALHPSVNSKAWTEKFEQLDASVRAMPTLSSTPAAPKSPGGGAK